MISAHVYWIELGCRDASGAPQRGQSPGFAASAGRDNSAHVVQETSPASAALTACALVWALTTRSRAG